ncbi:hypothetical protein A3Q56_01408 [Intoshia linei]|uniref:PAS domain-containing protein n=1 Tax=Intoshia linei TaxID=1819745 RepID=A0A177B947_9BILA|nr:hypothetical protein A3Q56_01408 [Intoshia linei]
MPIRRGNITSPNIFIDNIIQKFDIQNRNFLIANAVMEDRPIIYCSEGFSYLTGFDRGEVIKKSAFCTFLYGECTTNESIANLERAFITVNESKIQMIIYKQNDNLIEWGE